LIWFNNGERIARRRSGPGKDTFVLDSKGAPDVAAAAVAADQIVGLDKFFVLGFGIDDRRGHLVGALLEGSELGAIAQFDLR